jgi:hypothetical protein
MGNGELVRYYDVGNVSMGSTINKRRILLLGAF